MPTSTLTVRLTEHHRILVWLHVLLAIYWLGPDWGVSASLAFLGVVKPF